MVGSGAKRSQNWLLAVGMGQEKARVDRKWVGSRPELLSRWPVAGEDIPAIKKGERILYCAAGEKRLLAAGLATGEVDRERNLPVQLYRLTSEVPLSPGLARIGSDASRFKGKRAYLLEDSEFHAGFNALGDSILNR